MNSEDALIRLHRRMWDVLNEMAIDEDLTTVEVENVRDSMEELAELLVQALQPEVVSTGDDTATITVNI